MIRTWFVVAEGVAKYGQYFFDNRFGYPSYDGLLSGHYWALVISKLGNEVSCSWTAFEQRYAQSTVCCIHFQLQTIRLNFVKLYYVSSCAIYLFRREARGK
jgi:hypothetical protein